MSEMLDRVATVIRDRCNDILETPCSDITAVLIARDVFEAMREPTEAMMEAGRSGEYIEGNDQLVARETWIWMIRSALDEETE